jgi:hypothetical protein
LGSARWYCEQYVRQGSGWIRSRYWYALNKNGEGKDGKDVSMNKKSIVIMLIGLLLVLAACAPAATPTPTQAAQGFAAGGNGANGGAARPLNQETKLEIGIFKLEGTPNAVTAAEAKILLPLWQQVQTLNTSGSANQTEMQTVSDKILGALSADQANAIDAMNLTQADVQSMMQQLGIQITPGAFGGAGANGGTPFPTLSADERATRTAQRETQVASNGGTPVAGFNGTPGAGGFGGRGGGGFANMFIDPLIKLLQTRAGG